MTTTNDPTTALPGRPPIVDLATWQAARDELLVREKAHTREGDALAAARRRLPMVEIDGTVEVVGPGGPVPFLDLFERRDELLVYHSMWYDDTRRVTPSVTCVTATGCSARSDADGNANWGPTSRPAAQWIRPGATPVESLGRHDHHH